MLAGGGVTAGAVYGQSDKTAATPLTNPVSPNDILATIYHQLGIDHHQIIYDLEDRPQRISEGEPVYGVLT